MPTLTKQKRNMVAAGKVINIQPHEVHVRAMTNWQNSQWLRAGAIPSKAIDYVQLARIRVGNSDRKYAYGPGPGPGEN